MQLLCHITRAISIACVPAGCCRLVSRHERSTAWDNRRRFTTRQLPMIPAFLERWLPSGNTASRREQLRATAGALVGVMLTSLLSHYVFTTGGLGIYLVAPIGASSVLLFCLPASPLAQPWSVIGGNVVSGLVGAACVHWFGDSLPLPLLAGLACGGAIAAMFVMRCLHPPGGAVALTTVIGGPLVHAAGFEFVMMTVLADSVLLVLMA